MRHRASGGAWQDGEALDIGAGGTFLVDATWPVGTSVELAIDIAASDGALILPGVVRWVAGEDVGDEAEARAVVTGLDGVGVQFVGLDLDIVQLLQAHLASLAPDDPEGSDDGSHDAGSHDAQATPRGAHGPARAVDDDADVPATD